MKSQINYMFLILLVAFAVAISCNGPDKKVAADQVEVEEVVVVEDVFIIDEHQYANIPLTSKATETEIEDTKEVETESSQEAKESELEAEEMEDEIVEEVMEEEMYAIATAEAIHEDLMEAEYEAMENTWEVEEIAIPLDETQTVIAYNKKGEENSALQVVSNSQTGEIEQIIFADKKHMDVYDVEAGMTGKDVKKLRRELKHMVKKGQVFLYNDESNVMYLMDAQNMLGDEITAADVESMEVSAIVWKDKKHHKKEKHQK